MLKFSFDKLPYAYKLVSDSKICLYVVILVGFISFRQNSHISNVLMYGSTHYIDGGLMRFSPRFFSQHFSFSLSTSKTLTANGKGEMCKDK